MENLTGSKNNLNEKKKTITLLLLTSGVSFVLGLSLQQNNYQQQEQVEKMKRVTSIGGIFFKCKNQDKLKEWYSKHLGFNIDKYGTSFEWRQADEGTKKGFTAWSPFKEDTKYFDPSEKEFMVNYRVENIEWLVEELKKEGVNVIDRIEVYEYGKFVHIMDLEGNKIELWEPNDVEYDKMIEIRTK